MLRSILISPDPGLAKPLEAALAKAAGAGVVRVLDHYPADRDLPGIVRAYGPQLFFLDTSDLDNALRVAAGIAEQAPGARIVAFDRVCDSRVLLRLMHAGIREFVEVPEALNDLGRVLERVAAALERTPALIPATDELIAFLPAKPGVGCSTVALNAAAALAAENGTKVLLADFDLNCGIIAFLLNLDPAHSLVDAAEHAPRLDEELWPRLITSVGTLDVLPSGPLRPGFRIEPPAMRYLLDFARRNYNFICADLSGLMERYSVELMQDAKRIFVVCTPELPALHLARQKVEYLRSLDLEDRAALVLNRVQKRNLVSKAEVEKLIGLPVRMQIPNDYRGVHEALTDGKPVNARTELGKCYAELARLIRSKEGERKERTSLQ